MVKPALPLAAAFVLLAGLASAEETTALPSEWTSLAEETCVIAGRTIRATVEEHADAAAGTVVYKREACLSGEDMPVTCVAVLSEPEQLPAGASSGGRSFLVRCSPMDRAAWTIGTRWSGSGIDVVAQRLDLRGLTVAEVVPHENAPSDVVLDPQLPLMPDEAVTWSARDPQPDAACVPLAIAALTSSSGWELTITPAATSCTAWKVRHDAATGFTKAEPLPGYAAPDLKAAAPAGPLKLEPGKKAGAPQQEPPPERHEAPPSRDAGKAPLLSFSRR